VIRAETEEELLRKAADHARTEHGLTPSPELMAKVRAHIQEA
jgi:predicted small metal-binding protein